MPGDALIAADESIGDCLRHPRALQNECSRNIFPHPRNKTLSRPLTPVVPHSRALSTSSTALLPQLSFWIQGARRRSNDLGVARSQSEWLHGTEMPSTPRLLAPRMDACPGIAAIYLLLYLGWAMHVASATLRVLVRVASSQNRRGLGVCTARPIAGYAP